ncbi:Mut7-C RNAse domain-containing protein [Caldivirga maquilingensis]|uniref:Mut7-C RNAse domain-containing protein n=1 Tax=Caldivirga maquilingensis (strain ATCC 700844 / DSM 13496 / JCM 10307 / IC-167) TaxID=397948 RepID=A8MDJ5_CALMQ|nr:Mut7-C RNAse domain-containing protein [Caldivirga maquilingensis]ABW01851.1 protein of unknown function DUF82 [Caldivirga maquilingensis IC-167]
MRAIGLVKPCEVTRGIVYVDSMLGWLSRWLRMIGVMTIYRDDFSDDELAGLGGLVITRDRGLFNRRRGDTLLLLTDNHVHWLVASLMVLNVKPIIGDNSLCPVCGGRLIKVDSRNAAGEVPVNVIKRNPTLLKCESCGKYYWVGSHHRGIGRTLNMVNELISKCSIKHNGSECLVSCLTL